MRRKIVAANWKMNKTVSEALEFVDELKSSIRETEEAELVICPPFTALYPVSRAIEGTCLKLGAQDVYYQEKGAFTGEISPLMLEDLNCAYAIVGHSERRGYFKETDIEVNKKLRALLDHGIRPIVCVGETLEQREAGQTEELVTRQVEIAFDGVGQNDVTSVVIAYEPIWAIGTGRSATGEDANRVIGLIRRTLGKIYSDEIAKNVRIQYGGSVTPDNIAEFSRQPEIDGALVGGASLKASSFLAIARG
ncbi:MAG: triose-phosphate isomerase [Firmicutes bacterium]|nr:triose-phosphate isomerase [Bacillota bacterium]